MFEIILIVIATRLFLDLVEVLRAAFRESEPEDVRLINHQVKRPGAWEGK